MRERDREREREQDRESKTESKSKSKEEEQYTLAADPANSSTAAVAAAAADPSSLAAASADAITPECKKTSCDGLRGLEHEVFEHIAANWSHGLRSCTGLVLETSLPEDNISIAAQDFLRGHSCTEQHSVTTQQQVPWIGPRTRLHVGNGGIRRGGQHSQFFATRLCIVDGASGGGVGRREAPFVAALPDKVIGSGVDLEGYSRHVVTHSC
eukprot:CAMPEP_0179419652 /NCGR_PEP_ID=MMETSP0799-20121207/8720_1 /TAXON_ID=46947 /ORGANISM="Geminigera cryophila, Strain CCMP2564" /LENGTH=210 /DNA_ID=CAMNT_0021193153 /DNA_START=506 /DNA_END=1139 /DNA_ORIENTATION=-